MTAMVTTREYNPETGLLSNEKLDILSFGTVPPGTKSKLIVIDSVISGVENAGDLGIGIADTNIPSTLLSSCIYYSVLSTLDEIFEPVSPFISTSGYNGTGDIINVGFRSPLVSKYVVLMLRAINQPIDCGCLILKWFFGFSLKE